MNDLWKAQYIGTPVHERVSQIDVIYGYTTTPEYHHYNFEDESRIIENVEYEVIEETKK